jgi:mannose-6-phosphate isomerase-like protein (cupin superfamily)
MAIPNEAFSGESLSAPTPSGNIETLGTEHAFWNAKLLRCLSAGWAYSEDLRFALPLLAAAEAARRECFAILATRAGDKAATVLQAASNDGEWGAKLDSWRKQLQVDPGTPTAELPTFARYFARECIIFCKERAINEAAAFLLGGELATARIRQTVIDALKKADVETEQVTSRLHPHEFRAVLEEALAEGAPDQRALSAHHEPMEHALSLYHQLLEDMYQAMRFARLSLMVDRIQSRISLENEKEPPIPMRPGVGEIMLEERDDKRGILFTVERYPCTAETLDPRVVRIPPGKTNNRHKHAHETLFCFIEGTGRILVGETWVPVKPGDAVFVPRWATHQTHNTGDTELILLAITDYYLTHQVYIGKYDKI